MNATFVCMSSAGDSSWVLGSSVLVAGMIVGLGFVQAGAVSKHKIQATAALFVLGSSLLCITWILVGFSLVFGGDLGGVIGSLAHGALVDLDSVCLPKGSHVPGFVFALFQMMFGAIAPLLVVGCIAREDVSLGRLLAFLVAWQGKALSKKTRVLFLTPKALVYVPVAHSVWGGGWLQQLGTLDFAGGIVLHTSSGAAAAAVLLVRRITRGPAVDSPISCETSESAVLTSIGWILLVLGWIGFNSGSAYSSSHVAGAAAVNTVIGSIVGVLVFGLHDRVFGNGGEGPNLLVLFDGSLSGMAAVTPLSGFVQPWAALVVAFAVTCLTRVMVDFVTSRLSLRDTLNVTFIHGVTGVLGSWSVSVFASLAVNPNGANGLLFGNARLLWVQLVAIVVVIVWSFVVSGALARLVLWTSCCSFERAADAIVDGTSTRDFAFELHKPSERTSLL